MAFLCFSGHNMGINTMSIFHCRNTLCVVFLIKQMEGVDQKARMYCQALSYRSPVDSRTLGES